MSQALVLFSQEDGNPLPLTLRTTAEDLRVSTVTVGPGRILYNAYAGIGRSLEKKANLLAHQAGLGPIALTDRIEKVFGDSPKVRQEKLDKLYHILNATGDLPRDAIDNDFPKLKKECQKLMQKYVLPSEAAQTQLDAFRSIIMLTTRYTGLRKLLLQCKCSGQSDDSYASFEQVWMRPEEECPPEWKFAQHFAATCLSTTTIATLMEGCKPSELGGATETDSGVVDLLLFQFYAPERDPLKLLAIRYLGGVLEGPTFWDDDHHQVQCVAVKKLCIKVVELIEDTGIGSCDVEDMPDQLALLDLPGIDILSHSILVGVEGWMTASKEPEELRNECWVEPFLHLVELLESMDFLEVLPQSCYRATNTNWESLYNKRPNSIYEVVETKARLSASDIPQSAEIEASDSDSVANAFNENENAETVILVVGATGSGKSTFINTAYGTPVATVGHTLNSCTTAVQAFEIDRPSKGKIFLVDTPGFDDTYIDDTKIIKSLVDWLQQRPDRMLGGVICLHEITLSRMAWGPGDHIAFAKLLCGDSGLSNVLLATTKWGQVASAKGATRERELAGKYWQEMVQNGSTMIRFNLTQESAWEIIDSLLSKPPIAIRSLQDQQRSFMKQSYTAAKPKANIFGLFQSLLAAIRFRKLLR